MPWGAPRTHREWVVLKPSRRDRLAVVLLRVAGGAVCLFLAQALVVNWLDVFRPEVLDALLFRLFGIGCAYLDGGDAGLDTPVVWYAGAVGMCTMVATGAILGRRDGRLLWSLPWCLASTLTVSLLVGGCYRLALGRGMPCEAFAATVWPTMLLAYGGGWGLGYRVSAGPREHDD